MDRRIDRLISAPALSLIVAAMFIVAISGSDRATAIGLELKIFNSVDKTGERVVNMMRLLGAMHVLSACRAPGSLTCTAACLSMGAAVTSVYSTRPTSVVYTAALAAQAAVSTALGDWAAILDTETTVGTGTILSTVGAGLAVLAALAHGYESRRRVVPTLSDDDESIGNSEDMYKV